MKHFNEASPDRCIENDFKDIYERYSGRIYHFALLLTHGDEYLSEEILQTSFIQLWEHRKDLHSADNMLQYLYMTAKNTFFNYCRRETVEMVYREYFLTRTEEAVTEEEDRQDAESLGRYIYSIVESMPPVRRKVFLMSRYRQMSNKAIATALGISVKTVEVHITLALKQIRNGLKDENE